MIKQQTFDFLADLVANNDREWFATNKSRYEAARENVVEFADALLLELRKVESEMSPELDGKKCVMRS